MIFARPFRKPFWILKSFFGKHQRLIIFGFLIGVILFMAIKNLLPLLPQIKNKTKVGLVGQYTLNSLPPFISQQISRGLTKINETGEILPDLAESWEILEAETLYQVHLNKNNRWSDNSIIKARDLSFSIPDVSVSVPDDYTLIFKLKESYSPFLTLLSRPVFSKNNLGANQFMVKAIKYSGSYLKSIEMASFKENLFYRFYPSNEAAWLGFRLGEIDMLQNLLVNPLTPGWEAKVNLETKINQNQYIGLIFNLNDNYLSNKSLRQALAYALEQKSLITESRALTPINPNSWAFNPDVKPYNYNQSQAQELFDKFAAEATFSGQLEINLDTSQSFLSLAESIAASWEKVLNIKTNVKVVNSIDSNFQALLVAQEIPLDPDQHALWHSTQNTNITHYSNLKIDKLLEDGRKISDIDQRKEIYQDFQRFLLEDLPAIFLSYPTTYTISRK
ncbi:MAG: ABC transporter substrate-binding protein [Candidatus Beckwithbacteria bacterium]